MGWASIIAALLTIFGPMLIEWLKQWLESRMADAATRLPAVASFGSEGDARDALFDEAIRSLPRFAFARRSLLRRMKASAKDGVVDEAEFRDLAASAENE